MTLQNDKLKSKTMPDMANDGLMDIVHRIRTKAKSKPPSLKEITEEVEKVRAKRYARSKNI